MKQDEGTESKGSAGSASITESNDYITFTIEGSMPKKRYDMKQKNLLALN
jgi:hypothetical protein